MIIYILRHGQAEAQITSDEERRLTNKGFLDTERVLAARVKEIAGITSIWASPLVRAQQTAQIAQEYFPGISLQTTNLLVPESDPHAFINWLSSTQAAESDEMLLVSHQPLVSRLIGLLCGKPEGFYPMGTSSLAALNIQPVGAGLGELLWLDHAPH
jgi:phosphohistidine phosphatase